MKKLLLILLLPFTLQAQEQCKTGCGHITKEESDCVVRKRCWPEIRDQIKKRKAAEKELEETKKKIKLNRINLFVGKAPAGNLKSTSTGFKTEAKEVLGLQYMRDIKTNINLGVQVQTNKSFSIGIGLNF